jgi:3-ketosteroid 9alpha-monooxygenase subunit A
MTNQDEVRTIEAGSVPTRFARGWHCLGLADRFRENGPHAIRAFGTKLVVFADSQGKLNVLDGYCRHMGGDLSMGTIKGDSWPARSTTGAGAATASARLYPTRTVCPTRPNANLDHVGAKPAALRLERPAGQPAAEHVTIPRIEGAFDRVEPVELEHPAHRGRQLPRGDRQRGRHGALLLHPLRVPDVLQERLRGARGRAVPHSKSRPDMMNGSNYETELKSEAAYYGPSYMIDYLQNDYNGYKWTVSS